MCNSCRFMNAEFISTVMRHKITIHICDKLLSRTQVFPGIGNFSFPLLLFPTTKKDFARARVRCLLVLFPLSRELLPSTATLTKSSFLVDDGMKHHY